MFSCNLVNRFVLLVFFHRIFDKKTDFPLGSLRKVSSIEPPVVGRRSFCNLRLTYEASHPIACDGVVTDSGIPHFRVNTKVRSPSRSSFSHKMYHFAGALTYHARTVAGGESLLSAVIAASGNYPNCSELVFVARPSPAKTES